MKNLAALALSLYLISGPVLADTPKDPDPQPAKPAESAKPNTPKKVDKSASEFAAELEELRQAVQSQQEQITLLKEELAKRDRTAEVKSTASSLDTSVSDLRSSNDALNSKGEQEGRKASEEGPTSIRYKGITITPGGFVAAESVWRQRATSADINTPFTGIPLPGNSLSKVGEFNASGRQTRLLMAAETKIGAAKVTGYFETDFLGAGTTSNNRQSNSYVFRQRQLWAQAAFDSGWSFTGGQMWSLATENQKGILNRKEALPMQIDAQYVVGFTWQRAYEFRVVKSWDKLALGVSIEGPQTTVGGRGFSTFTPLAASPSGGGLPIAGTISQNSFLNAPGAGGGLYNAFDSTGYSLNQAPDFLLKAAIDPGWGHYEIFGILSTFRARVFPCAVVGAPTIAGVANPAQPTLTCPQNPAATTPQTTGAFNDTRSGGGIGASARVPLFNKKLDIGAKVVYGTGIGRFGSAQLADVTIRPDGTLSPIHTAHGLGIIEWHVTPKLDIYGYAGAEYAGRASYAGYQTVKVTPVLVAPAAGGAVTTNTTTIATSNTVNGGYGNALFNNSGCNTETTPASQNLPGGGGSCAGDIRVIIEGTVGFWHKFYSGSKGRVQWGIQYAYLVKNAWSGTAAAPNAASQFQPQATENMLFTSFRYYLP